MNRRYFSKNGKSLEVTTSVAKGEGTLTTRNIYNILSPSKFKL